MVRISKCARVGNSDKKEQVGVVVTDRNGEVGVVYGHGASGVTHQGRAGSHRNK